MYPHTGLSLTLKDLLTRNLISNMLGLLKLLKKLNVNIPFTNVVTQMPTYAKFLKDILSNRRKLDDEMVTLTEKVSVIVMNKLPLSCKTRVVLPYLIL
jgi:hypothetical protein